MGLQVFPKALGMPPTSPDEIGKKRV